MTTPTITPERSCENCGLRSYAMNIRSEYDNSPCHSCEGEELSNWQPLAAHTITPEERAQWRNESRADYVFFGEDGRRLLKALDALESAEAQIADLEADLCLAGESDIFAREVIRETEVRARQIEAERDWLIKTVTTNDPNYMPCPPLYRGKYSERKPCPYPGGINPNGDCAKCWPEQATQQAAGGDACKS